MAGERERRWQSPQIQMVIRRRRLQLIKPQGGSRWELWLQRQPWPEGLPQRGGTEKPCAQPRKLTWIHILVAIRSMLPMMLDEENSALLIG